jgi:multidrug resistance protein
VFLLAAIQFSHIVDFVVLMPLGPVLMRTLNITPLQFGTLVSSYNISAAVTGILYGVVADKYDRKVILQINFVGFILGTIACGMAQSFETLVVARIIAGGFGGTLTSVVMAMVTDLIPFERRGKALGVVMSAFSIASILGVPIGLLIAETFDWHYTFYFIAFFSFLVLILSSLVFPKLDQHVKKSAIRENIQRLLKLLFKLDYLKCYFLTFVNVFSIFCIIPYLSPYAVKNIGILETDLKYMYFVGGVCTVIAANIIGKLTDRIGAFKVMMSLIIISFAPMYLYSHAGPMPFIQFLIIASLFMMVVSGRMIPLMTMISDIVDSEDRGTFMGLMNAIRSMGTALATVFAGFIMVENSDGTLSGFDHIGLFSIGLSFLTIFYFRHIYKILLRVQHERKSS